MTALAHEVTPVVDNPVSDLDGILWQAWKAMDLPEGYRAEIIEGAIEVSPTGRRRHTVLINRLRDLLVVHLRGGDYAAYQDGNILYRRKCWVPDLFLASRDLDETPDEEGLGVDAAGVALVVEVVSPGHCGIERDRIRKRREYARAGIPVYVIIDDFDEEGTVSILTAPDPEKAVYEDEHRVSYGHEAIIPSGPAKGFVIGEAITRHAGRPAPRR